MDVDTHKYKNLVMKSMQEGNTLRFVQYFITKKKYFHMPWTVIQMKAIFY